jgi:hypothetical protein
MLAKRGERDPIRLEQHALEVFRSNATARVVTRSKSYHVKRFAVFARQQRKETGDYLAPLARAQPFSSRALPAQGRKCLAAVHSRSGTALPFT